MKREFPNRRSCDLGPLQDKKHGLAGWSGLEEILDVRHYVFSSF